jgi:hypothetical protein
MPKKITVLRPFVFSHAAADSRFGTEHPFAAGVHELDDDHPLLAHDWFTKHRCDGKVETEEDVAERLAAKKAAEDIQAEEGKQLVAAAQKKLDEDALRQAAERERAAAEAVAAARGGKK